MLGCRSCGGVSTCNSADAGCNAIFKGVHIHADRAARCPYAILLARHCQLPPGLARRRRRRHAGTDDGQTAPAAAPAAVAVAAQEAPAPQQHSLAEAAALQEQPLEPPGSPMSCSSAETSFLDSDLTVAARTDTQPSQPSAPQPQLPQQNVSHAAAAAAQPAADAAQPAGTVEAHADAPQTPAAASGAAAAGASAAPAEQHASPSSRAAAAGLGQQALLAAALPHARVIAFVWSCIRHVVPPALLGDKSTRRALRAAVAQLVTLRRQEHMTVAQALLLGVRSTSFPWGKSTGDRPLQPSEAAAAQRDSQLWVAWLLGGLAVPLLRAHFYATETEPGRQSVSYYRKPVWAALRAQVQAALVGDLYAPLPPGTIAAAMQSRRLGAARLRLLPKATGLRPIANLGCGTSVRLRGGARPVTLGRKRGRRRPATQLTFRPVNQQLQHLHQVLKLEAVRQPGVLGGSVFGYGDAHAALAPALQRWRAASAAATARGRRPPKPYLLSFDISRAFDGVPTERLLGLAQRLLAQPSYTIVKYSETSAGRLCLRPRFRKAAVDAGAAPPDSPSCNYHIISDVALHGLPQASAGRLGLRPRYRKAATDASAAPPDFPAFARGVAAGGVGAGRVLTDQVVTARVDARAAGELLAEHVGANLVKIGRAWHTQTRGIPQGSMLSTLLCSLFLADVEARHLRPLLPAPQLGDAAAGPSPSPAQSDSGGIHSGARGSQGPGSSRRLPSVLVRLVDDFLLLTPSAAAATAVLRRALQGFEDEGVSVNPAKTKLSFDCAAGPGGILLPRRLVHDGAGNAFLPWCGLLINTATLEIQADYTRYTGTHLAASLTLPLGTRPGAGLATRLPAYLRPKCAPILLDPALMSPATLRLNVYQCFLLAAMKFHCHCAALPSRGAAADARCALSAIEAGIAFVRSAAIRGGGAGATGGRVAGGAAAAGGARRRPGVSGCHVRWLGLTAFRTVLRRKQAAYGALLAKLEAELKAPAFRQLPAHLAAVTDIRRSSHFDSIRF